MSRIRVKFPLREELTWWIDFSARLISLNGWNLIQGQKHTVFHLDSSSIAQIDLKSSLKPNLSNGILDVDFVHIIREVNYDKILFKIFRETSNTQYLLYKYNDWSNLSRSDSIIDRRQVIYPLEDTYLEGREKYFWGTLLIDSHQMCFSR